MTEPIIYGPSFSTYVRSVRLALEEKGAAYRIEEVNILEGKHREPAHLARHPFGKVPAFEHDGFALYETGAILRYVDQVFPEPALQPDEPRARARCNQVLGIVDSYGYAPIIGQIVIQRLVVPLLGGTPDEEIVAAAVDPARTTIGALEMLLGGATLFGGESPVLADLHLVPVYDYFSQTPEGEEILGGAPGLARWWSEVRDRPSVKKTKPALG